MPIDSDIVRSIVAEEAHSHKRGVMIDRFIGARWHEVEALFDHLDATRHGQNIIALYTAFLVPWIVSLMFLLLDAIGHKPLGDAVACVIISIILLLIPITHAALFVRQRQRIS